jgi:hypothetical protein
MGMRGWCIGHVPGGSSLYLRDASVNTSERFFKAWIVETCRC